ncbi:MAG: cupin domain-containing protein [Planctomycetes bacterium]|nr:cupin domain-containing protein [Planctomycetota bacterium]
MSNPSYLLLQPGGGERLRFLDDSVLVIKDAGSPVDGGVAHYEYIAEPAANGSPQHIHRGHDETFHVVEGSFEFTLGSTTVAADPGTFLLVRRGQPHGFRNRGTTKGRILGTFGPRFAQYFRELAQIIERTGKAPSPEDWVELYGRFDTVFHEPR